MEFTVYVRETRDFVRAIKINADTLDKAAAAAEVMVGDDDGRFFDVDESELVAVDARYVIDEKGEQYDRDDEGEWHQDTTVYANNNDGRR